MLIWPSEQQRTASISTANTLPSSITVCLSFSSIAGAVDAFSVHHRSREVVSRGLATGRRMLPELRYPFHFERVDVPTMLIWGDRDRMVSHEGSDRLLAAIPGARYELLEGIGHCPQVEAPDRVTELLLDLDLDAIPPARAPLRGV